VQPSDPANHVHGDHLESLLKFSAGQWNTLVNFGLALRALAGQDCTGTNKPEKVWVGDITYIATDEGWVFLAVVVDLFRRQVVGWSLRGDMTRDLVIDALRMAWFKRHRGKQAGLIFRSDRGSQYASYDFRAVLAEYGITGSMSRKGNCWDNACSETLFGSLRVERLHGQRLKTRREAKGEIIDWLLWYNRARLHSTLAYVSPMQFELDWLADQPRQVSS
jgi:putative transposase